MQAMVVDTSELVVRQVRAVDNTELMVPKVRVDKSELAVRQVRVVDTCEPIARKVRVVDKSELAVLRLVAIPRHNE